MHEDGRAGPFHYDGNKLAMNRMRSTVLSSSGISLAGLLTFLQVMRWNAECNNIFLCHGGKKPIIFCHPPSNSVFLSLQGMVLFVGFLLHFEKIKSLSIALKSFRAPLFLTTLKEESHGIVCLSESHRGVKF